jgi:hypothetical protein
MPPPLDSRGPDSGFTKVGPAFSDDPLGWLDFHVSSAVNTGGTYLDKIADFVHGNAAKITDVVDYVDRINRAPTAFGREPLIGGKTIEETKDILTGLENKARAQEERYKRLQQIVNGELTPVIGLPTDPDKTEPTKGPSGPIKSSGDGRNLWKTVK